MKQSKMKHQVVVLEDETPRAEGTRSARGRKQKKSTKSSLLKEAAAEPELSEDSVTNVQSCERKIHSCRRHVIGTWNVRNMDERKLEIIKQEMKRINIALLGVSELNWIGKGRFQSDDYVVFYSGNDKLRRNGVAFIVRQDVAQVIRRYNPKSDRVIAVRLQGQPLKITILQVHAPGPNATAEETESFYASIQEEVDQAPQQDVLLIVGDWNATVGNKAESNIVGEFGLGIRNEAGKRLIEFCAANDLFIANTCFRQPNRRLYTWTSPKGQFRHQIDYIIGRRRWRNSILSAKTKPGADCGTDHKLLIATIKVKLKNYKRSTVRQYNASEGYKDHVSDSVSHKQEELWTETRDDKDMGNMAASFLVHEKIWFDKFRYDAAEKSYYEHMSGSLDSPSDQQSASSPSSAGRADDQSELIISLAAEHRNLRRAYPEVSTREGHPCVLEKGST